MIEYIVAAATVWFLGFFPLFEIYVAIPAGVALGLDPVSNVAWAVFGNYTPILLIHFGYEQLRRVTSVRDWLDRRSSERFRGWLNRWGVWCVLFVTPWTGVWIMAATMKSLGMDSSRFLIYSFASILLYAVALVALIELGISVLT
ncbi:MAG TPA: small multi-drug export protein [Thermomicrobiales bacterium]|nr:small multi-drug export protein [Thermomicrobiales bacterium]